VFKLLRVPALLAEAAAAPLTLAASPVPVAQGALVVVVAAVIIRVQLLLAGWVVYWAAAAEE
jgi:hypothetical protein